jgi:hypothetical protein
VSPAVRVAGSVLALSLTGCTWQDFNYGPAEYLRDRIGLPIQSIHPDHYEWLADPDITVYYTEDHPCGLAEGCTVGDVIYLSPRASEAVLAHELKHARGWCHHEPDLMGKTGENKEREIERARYWYPCRTEL